MSKSVRKIASVALPIALSVFAPGVGTALGAGLGLSGTAAGVAGNALIGAGAGALGGGGLKSALMGAASGGLSGAASSGLSSPNITWNATPANPGAVTSVLSKSGMAQSAGGGLADILKGGGAGGGMSLSNAGTLLSGINSYMKQDEMEDQLLKAQGRAEGMLAPYSSTGQAANSQLSQRLAAGFDPSDLQNDPSYQFQLDEGQKALERSLAARGMGSSGTALKAAQQYGQNYANQAYGDAYTRWLQQNQQLAGQAGQGYSAAGNMAGLAQNVGNINANATVGRTNALNSTLSSVLSGSGSRKILYIDANGQPVYG